MKGSGYMRKAAYAGSFDPFTNGHLDILKKAAKMFDEVHVIIGYNADKKRHYNIIYSQEAIENVLKNREEVMKLYRQWKKDFDKKCEELVEEFIKIN